MKTQFAPSSSIDYSDGEISDYIAAKTVGMLGSRGLGSEEGREGGMGK